MEQIPLSEPWYKDGLRFTCTQCGHCCTGDPGYVWVNQEELEALAKHRGESMEQIIAAYTKSTVRGPSLREKPNGDCVFYEKTVGCTVYSVRPRQCRTWPFWESNLVNPETWAKTNEYCPGSDHGELIPAEEITRRLRLIRL